VRRTRTWTAGMKKDKEKAEVRNSKWVGGWQPWQPVSSSFFANTMEHGSF
jgi:hypothetical protein